MATKRPDTWRSVEHAVSKSPHLRTWDKRVLQLWVENGYRSLPTAIYPSRTEGVTLKTTKHQETMTYTYINPRKPSIIQFPGEESQEEQQGTNLDRQLHRAEPIVASKLVAHLGPRILYISGAKSPLYKAGTHTRAAKKTGKGYGGSKEGADHVVIEKAGHAVPLEKVGNTAEAMGRWIGRELARWGKEEARLQREWGQLSIKEKSKLPLEWYETLEMAKKENEKSKL